MSWPVLVFDIETIPDVRGLRGPAALGRLRLLDRHGGRQPLQTRAVPHDEAREEPVGRRTGRDVVDVEPDGDPHAAMGVSPAGRDARPDQDSDVG